MTAERWYSLGCTYKLIISWLKFPNQGGFKVAQRTYESVEDDLFMVLYLQIVWNLSEH